MNKDAELLKDYEAMRQRIDELKKKAEDSKVSKLWAIFPVGGWVYIGYKNKKHKGYKKQLIGEEQCAEEAETGIKNI